jgi:hypothetical protein
MTMSEIAAAASVLTMAETKAGPPGTGSTAFGDPIRVESPAARTIAGSTPHRIQIAVR